MSASRYLGEFFCKKYFALLFVLLSLSACGKVDKPTDSDIPPLKDITFSLSESGEVIIKDAKGTPIGDKCSADPKSENVCSVLKPGHKVEIQEISSITIIKHIGSSCFTVLKYPGPHAAQICK